MKNTGIQKKIIRKYYGSSLLPSFTLILIYYLLSKSFGTGFTNEDRICIGVLVGLIFCFIYMTISLIRILKKGTDTNTPVEVTLKMEKNPNTLNTFLSVVVSIISMFGIVENPIPTLVIIVLIYYLLYRLVLESTDYYPNITLVFLGWTGMVGTDKNDVTTWIFYKKKQLDKESLNIYNNSWVHLFGRAKGSDLRIGVLDTDTPKSS